MNMYYTFSPDHSGNPHTIKSIEPIILEYNPVQLVINDLCIWDDKYDDLDAYISAIERYANYIVKELWISVVEEHHSIVKINTQENDNGT